MSQEQLIPGVDLDSLANDFLTSNAEETIIVKAEELPTDGGVDFSETFFEPQVGNTYTVKFIKNPFGENLTHRRVYKDLPDPQRKGKTFHFVSSGSATTCKALDLFFKLNNLKKSGDALAELKIKEYMGTSQQACVIVQIINSPVAGDIGKYKLMTFPTWGQNAHIANLINEKLNPTKEQIAEGFEKEDIFNILDSPTMLISCIEAVFDGQKGRDFSKSSWSKKNRGAFVTLPDGTQHVFSKSDLDADGKWTPAGFEAFKVMIKELSNPVINVHNYFSYKTIDDAKNTEETKKYLINLYKKVDEIIPVIENAKSIAEIANYGVGGEPVNDGATIIGNQKAEDILKSSIPTELDGVAFNEPKTANQQSVEDILGEN